MLEKFLSRANKGLLVRLISENFRAQAPWYAISMSAMVVVAAMTSASAWIMKDIVNETVVSKDLQRVFEISAVVAIIFIVKGVASYVQSIFLSKAGNNIIAETQKNLYEHILKQGAAFYSKFPSSELLMRITNNAQSARAVIELIATSLVRDLFSLIGLVCVMVIQQPILSLASLIIGPGAIFGVRILTKKVRKIMEQELASIAMIIRSVQETSTGIKVIKAFGLEEHMRRRMEKYVGDVEMRANSIARLEAASSPIMETLSGLAIAAIFALSGIWVLQEGNTPGELMSFVTALLLAYEPAKRLARMRISLEAGLIGVRMMFELADHPIDIKDDPEAVDLPAGPGEISFNALTFGYKGAPPLFKNFNLTFPAGKATALVGPSGGGKSTIINLIMRMYDADAGSVTIDGHDIKSVTLASLRRRMAYVGQDTFLFSGTIRHNIALGAEDVTDDDIVAAAKAANAHEFIVNLPNGYESDVDENGGNLSGGQRQRVAIARAILRNAEILILDEATSSLDSKSEVQIREALLKLTKDRTTIMIAHRLSSITAADYIVFIEKGSIAEQGPPDTLLRNDGPYRQLYELQLLRGTE